MFGIDDPSAAALKPAVPPAGVPGWFQPGNPATATPGTRVRFYWLNMIQAELAAVIAAAGLAPDKTNDGQLLQALAKLTRIRLTGPLTLYVSPTGSDVANDGSSPAKSFATPQAAWNRIISAYDLSGFSVNVQIADGAYTTPLVCQGAPVGFGFGNSIGFSGNLVTPANVVLRPVGAHCIQAVSGATVAVSGMTLQTSGTTATAVPPSCLVAAAQGSITVGPGMVFGSCSGFHMYATQSSAIGCSSNYAITGSAQSHQAVTIGSLINNISATCNITGAPNFSGAFVFATSLGLIQNNAFTYTGAATGQRYSISTNSVILTNGAGASYYPGSTAGSLSTGGQYV